MRRAMRRGTIVVGLMLAVWFGIEAPARAAPPNIVMIISDDQAWGDYGFMGHEQIRTPNLDELASESLVFRRGYVPSSLCSPSLASILTGLYPHQHKVTSNDPPLKPGLSNLEARRDPDFLAQRQEMVGFFDQVPTLPRILGEAGYASFQAGKWWGGNFTQGGFTDGMTHGDPDKGGRHGDKGLAIGREGLDPVVSFIDEAVGREQPFFLWYAPMMPHQPHTPPDRLLERYRDQTESLELAKYWAMCEWFDETCGQLLDHLDEEGITDNTLVVYLADNGWLQDLDADRYAPRSKQSPYDGGLRTPIMIRWPGQVMPRMSGRLASSIDLAPTILTAAGLAPTPAMMGIDLLDRTARRSRNRIFGEIFAHNAVDIHRPASSLRYRWVLEGDWKLIVPDPRNEPNAKVELFNLESDPMETRDLAEHQPRRVEDLKRRIDSWWPADG